MIINITLLIPKKAFMMISKAFIFIQAVITAIFFIGCSEEDADNPAVDFSVNWENSVLFSTENYEAAMTTKINDCISISGNYVHTALGFSRVQRKRKCVLPQIIRLW